MQPFNSVISNDGYFTPRETSCEMIAFDSEHLNIFAAEVVYCQPHWHEAPELIYVLDGEFEMNVEQSIHVVRKGEFLYIGSDIIHSLEQTQPHSTLITWQFASSLFDLMHVAPNGYITLSKCNEEYAKLHNVCFTHLASLQNFEVSRFDRLAKIYLILAQIEKISSSEFFHNAAVKSREERIIRESIDFINCNFHQTISVADLARHANLSYFHFSRLFKKISGYTAAEYIAMIRVNMAKPLLKDIHLPITEISNTVGFNEHRLMTVAFKKYSGETPSEYRKRFLSDSDWRSASSNLNAFPNKPIKLKDIF
ncbi:helix-turn-helix transcriptional regulator [Vibrio metschnikovii]|uniref:helix-turn-helix transcriptional regulator n=1 Tax=Vibrio metschnikovii TaxID=28172 RepID=UPI001C2F23DE|nr:helix-turn-helix domain-containing protein [Vibrio metschnikovii]